MAISPVTTDTAINQQSKTAIAGSQLAKDFTQFLTLLTTQLQNQDPLSPMDSNQFTQQLVAFAGVEQSINTNQKLDSLLAMNLSNALNSSLGYVGMDVSYLSSEFNYEATTPIKITYAQDAESVSTKISIQDETGKTIFEAPGTRKVGKNEFTWDGSLTNGGHAPAGTYTVKISAFDAEDNAISSSTVVSGRVHGVETQNGIVNLLIGARAVPLANVLNAVKPTTTASNTP